jgi:Uri superfamily endonuclease
MTSHPGTYALLLSCRSTGPVRIGRLGTLELQPGFYVYIGSAFGPGGLSARINHHRQIAARPHWHIDYLRAACDLVEVWFTTKAARREHAWAKTVARLPGAGVPMPGFGSSDCECAAHLFWFERLPLVWTFRQQVKTTVSSTSAPKTEGATPTGRTLRLRGMKPAVLTASAARP